MFDDEKLDVYQLELKFISWVTTLFDNLKTANAKRIAEVSEKIEYSTNGERRGDGIEDENEDEDE